MRYKKDKGMAIIAVLTLIIILVALTTTLVSTSKEHLFTTSKHYDKSVAQNLGEAAVSEAILKLKQSSSWGESSGDYLLMRSGNQDATVIGAGVKDPNSAIPYNIKGAYYITFDPNATVPYSYNNLDGGNDPNGGWQGRNVPAGSANIIANVAVGNVVKRVEVYVTIPAGGSVPVMPTIGGEVNLTFQDSVSGSPGILNMFCINSSGTPIPDPPTLHGNYSAESASASIKLHGDTADIHILNSGTLTAKGDILDKNGNNLIDGSTYKNDEREVPDIDISSLPTGVATHIDPGTMAFQISNNKVKYKGVEYGDGDTIADGIKVEFRGTVWVPKPSIVISKNIEVDGDLTLKGLNLEFDGTSGPPYIYLKNGGNLTLKGAANSAGGNVSGEGKIYALGSVSVDTENQGEIYTGAGGDISIYSGGNVFLDSSDNKLTYYGLIYSKGNFTGHAMGSDITFYGSLLIKGNLTLNAEAGYGRPSSIIIGIDKDIIPPAAPTGGSPHVKFWQDF